MTIVFISLTTVLAVPPVAQSGAPPGRATTDEVAPPDATVDVDEEMKEALPEEATQLERDMERSKARAQGKTVPANNHGHGNQHAGQTGDPQSEGHTHGLMEERHGTSPAEPGEKKETADWAEEGRWERYGKRGRQLHIKSVRVEQPEVFRRRLPGLALALGAVVGFGAGHYYAGENRAGLVFSGVDATLVAGFVATTVVLNQLVIEHDFRSGKSLARDERDFGKREERLYAASIVLATGLAASHVWQGIWSMRAAWRTNDTLQGVAVAPTAGGGAVQLAFGF